MTPPEAAPMREDVTQLLPCPRCGNRAFLTINFEVWCRTDRCLKLPPRASRAEAADAWNTRSYTARPDAGDEVERVCRVLAKADGLDWDEVCAYEKGTAEEIGDASCNSSTCVAAHYEDHDPDVARGRYRKQAEAIAAQYSAAMREGVDRVAYPDIGPDPMKGDRSDRFEEAIARVREDVTQADRDLAEAIVSHTRGYAVRLPNDGHTAIQLAARFRLAHTAHPDAGDAGRYHFTDENPFEVRTVEGTKKLGRGWLAITEAEYAGLRARPDAGDEVERVARAISHVVNPWDHDGDQWEGYEDEARAALAAMREGVDRGMVEEVPAVPEWLAKVLAENVARFDALPLAIKNARFSYVAAAALSRKGG
ncbi:hypothetical protein [Sphingomonas sp. PSPC2-2]|jgi:hypothetical protein